MSGGMDRLILFTRYPEPGTTKTRLIPALGAVGAANLHRQLVDYTLSQVRHFAQQSACEVEIWFTGGDRAVMQAWLGDNLRYKVQPSGSLGERMDWAISSTPTIQPTVIIGTDCPELDAAILQAAFQALRTHDLVLGPAFDGGYYLIGLQRSVPELFQGIAWSTDQVLQQTLAIAQSLHLTTHLLATLADIDRPEDLAVWERLNHPQTLSL